ncbi:Hint domain-containing protein [Marinovum algicola]|uniref:Hint domain-containing protein n=1 Tax=Marinovum algicola TaxID=42444 RepID=UPI0032EBE3E8
MSNFDPSSVSGLIGLWNFQSGNENADTGIADGETQNGVFFGDGSASSDRSFYDGYGDRFDVGGNDDPFDLDKGTIELRFEQDSHIGTDHDTLVNRGEAADKDTEGHFSIVVTDDGEVKVQHYSNGEFAVLRTSEDFFEPGDIVDVKYSWDATTGATLEVHNLTKGTTETINSDQTGLTLNVGDDDGQSFSFGAREQDDDRYDQFFDGKLDYVAIYTGGGGGGNNPDGAVDGEETGELMELGYDDSNAPTDGGGDMITNGDDLIYGNGGDDTINGAGGNDTIFGGEGSDVVVDLEGDNVIDTGTGLLGSRPDKGYPGLFPGDTDPDNDRDSVTTGDGNDSITTGDDADTIVSGGGDDTINAGVDDDEVDAGDGDDLIISGEGNDLVEGGDGNDTIYGGLGPSVTDDLNITDDDTGGLSPDLRPDNGMDTIYGGAGNDVIYGEDDNDELHGGDDDDYIDGGIDEDTLYGDAGEDTLIGGQDDDMLDGGTGDDEMEGGIGNDVFVENGGDGADTITDFGVGDSGPINDGDQTNNDFIDLGSFYNASTVDAVNNSDGDASNDFGSALGMLRADAADGRIDGIINGVDYKAQIGDVDITLQDGSGNAVTGSSLTFDNTNVACFVRGTLIATREGSKPIEELKAGDELITMDHGFQKIRWIGSTTVPASGDLAPVVIRKGAMGNERDLRVSPQHRMLVRGWHVELMFGKPEALVPAKALINDETVFQLEGGKVEYFHVMFDRHEVIYAEGIPSESFHPGHVGLGSFAEDTREEIFTLFPELREDVTAYSGHARPTLKVKEARVLAENPELIRE